MWVGVVYDWNPDNDNVAPEWTTLNIVIVYNPDYSRNKVWRLYSSEEENYGRDPDEHKLERAWGRKIEIRRIFEGSLGCWNDVEALFYAETLHGDFNCRVLRNLRSVHREKAEMYQTKLNESYELVTDLIAAEKSMSSHEASQQAYKIAKILKADTMDVVHTPHALAEKLGKMGSDCPSWPETLQRLKRRLLGSQAKVELLLYRVAKKETHKK
jgi:hypothetical protein